MKKNEYKCALCGKIYEKGWSNEEANEEALELWGVENANKNDDMAVICDDCFKNVSPKRIKKMSKAYKFLSKLKNGLRKIKKGGEK